MKLLDSSTYKFDLERAIENIDLSELNGKAIFITGGLGLIASSIVDVLLVYGGIGKIYVGARKRRTIQKKIWKL